MAIARTQTIKINANGDVAMFLAIWNQKLDNITVTGAPVVKLSNNNIGHIHTSTQEPHKFPVVLLCRDPADQSGYFHDLWFEAAPNSVLTITWEETYVPYENQPNELRYSVLYPNPNIKI